ncbi:translation initiation factor IF-2 [Chrysemys picta bellii]|uniref:translation initiation factor IF-2 n=1 Tax=Chrysemys picta bellii TaxID=8478 RepID=UPI0032B2D077
MAIDKKYAAPIGSATKDKPCPKRLRGRAPPRREAGQTRHARAGSPQAARSLAALKRAGQFRQLARARPLSPAPAPGARGPQAAPWGVARAPHLPAATERGPGSPAPCNVQSRPRPRPACATAQLPARGKQRPLGSEGARSGAVKPGDAWGTVTCSSECVTSQTTPPWGSYASSRRSRAVTGGPCSSSGRATETRTNPPPPPRRGKGQTDTQPRGTEILLPPEHSWAGRTRGKSTRAWSRERTAPLLPAAQFSHDKLQAVLGRDPTATVHATVDVSEEPKPRAPALNWKEDKQREVTCRGVHLYQEPGPA